MSSNPSWGYAWIISGLLGITIGITRELLGITSWATSWITTWKNIEIESSIYQPTDPRISVNLPAKLTGTNPKVRGGHGGAYPQRALLGGPSMGAHRIPDKVLGNLEVVVVQAFVRRAPTSEPLPTVSRAY